jgi:hypothetical protein
MAGFTQAPTWLLVLAITSIALGALLLLLLGWHLVRRMLDVPRIPRGAAFYAIAVVACIASIASGITALAVAAALNDWDSQAGPGAIAEVHCRRTGPNRVEVSYVPIGADGKRGPEETQAMDSVPCAVAVEKLHFSQPLARLGLMERHRLSGVGAARRGSIPLWRALPQPMGLPIASAEAQQVAIPSEDGAPYRVVADDRGLRVEKLAP